VEAYFLFFIASIVAGVINAVAGGGGSITFPLLMLVTGPMTADATSAVAGFASYPTAVWRTRNLLTGVLGSVRSIVIRIGLAVASYYFWKVYSPAVMHVGGE
jgi:uncharacterized membrane protein YfcA